MKTGKRKFDMGMNGHLRAVPGLVCGHDPDASRTSIMWPPGWRCPIRPAPHSLHAHTRNEPYKRRARKSSKDTQLDTQLHRPLA